MPHPPPLATYARDLHSQFGEDGIIAEMLARLRVNPGSGWAVEFGAWDGRHLSNTAALIDRGFRAVMIEPDRDRFAQLQRNYPGPEVVKVRAAVNLAGPDTLDGILARTPLPSDFDLLSIDIDGADYHVFAGLVDYRPKVVVIEFNPTIPNEVHYIQPADIRIRRGASAAALVALAGTKGFTLAAVTAVNLILVRDDVADAVLGQARPTLAELRDDAQVRNFLFVGFDGTVITSTPVVLPNHRQLPVPARALQVLPRFLRKYPAELSLPGQLALAAMVAWRDPRRVAKALASHGVSAWRIDEEGGRT